MAETSDNTTKETVLEDEETFEELGLDARLIRALLKKGIEKPTPIQRVAIPLILVSHTTLILLPLRVYCF